MIEFGFDIGVALPWFVTTQGVPYVRIEVTPESVASWPVALRDLVRRSYASDEGIAARMAATGFAEEQILAALLPSPGSTMSGDFGEILTCLFHATTIHPVPVIVAKKHRLKVDRSKPAPFSDVLHFVVPNWPQPSTGDRLLCTEVKTKATPADSSAVAAAVDDSRKDQTKRLVKTLVWLRERATVGDLGVITVSLLNRFIEAVDHPSASREFHAMVVVCSALVAGEIARGAENLKGDYKVVVLSVPNLKDLYESVYAAAMTPAT